MHHTPAHPMGSSTPAPLPPFKVQPMTPGPVVLSAAYAARLSFLLAHSARLVALYPDPIREGETGNLGARLLAEAECLAELLKEDEPMTRAEQLAAALDGR